MDAGTWSGKMLGKYEIGPLVGQGGMAQVYRGRHPALNREVAIKLIHSHLVDSPGFLERFQREAQLVASLRHPNIVQVYDLDVYEGVYFMVMEFIDGLTLHAQLEQMCTQNELFSISQTVDLILSLCNALDYAHAKGMIHRDVKPGNVMFTSKGQAVLTDFGLAKIVGGTTSTASGLLVGTPMYMSPEQAYGESGDARSDIYSLGVVFFEMATGQFPFQGDTPLSIIFKKVNEPLPSPKKINPRIPDAIGKIILKATERNPQDRYQTCSEFAEALLKAPCTEDPQMDKPDASAMSPDERHSTPTEIISPRKRVTLDGLRPIFIRILGPVGRMMEVDRIVKGMHENPTSFPLDRLDELLDRINISYRVTDKEKKAQIRQEAYILFGNPSKEKQIV